MATRMILRKDLNCNCSATPPHIVIRKIDLSDLSDALRLGWEDFKAIPITPLSCA